jgi:hypothetical protein
MTRQPKFRGLLKGSTQTVCAVGAIMVYDPDLVDQQYPYQVIVAAAPDHRPVASSAPRDVMLILRPSLASGPRVAVSFSKAASKARAMDSVTWINSRSGARPERLRIGASTPTAPTTRSFLGEGSAASRPRAVIAAAAESISPYAAAGTSARLATASIARTT